MSFNPALHEGRFPIPVALDEQYMMVIDGTRLSVESGNGYPGQGGCFYGTLGTLYVSKYRVVYVERQFIRPEFRSFSIPLYAVKEWRFYRGYLGNRVWSGKVNQVPGGGLNGIGLFNVSFKEGGLTDFEDTVVPLLADSRRLAAEIQAIEGPAVALLPVQGGEATAKSKNSAFSNPRNPFEVFVAKTEEKNDTNDELQ